MELTCFHWTSSGLGTALKGAECWDSIKKYGKKKNSGGWAKAHNHPHHSGCYSTNCMGDTLASAPGDANPSEAPGTTHVDTIFRNNKSLYNDTFNIASNLGLPISFCWISSCSVVLIWFSWFYLFGSSYPFIKKLWVSFVDRKEGY